MASVYIFFYLMNIDIPSWILIHWHLIEMFLAWFGLILSQDCDVAAVMREGDLQEEKWREANF